MKNKLIFLFVILYTCALWPFQAHASPDETVELSVKNGDTLIHICREYLEDPLKWPEIARINRLKDPDRIRPGQKLVVPVALLRGVPSDGLVTFVKGRVSLYIKSKNVWKGLQFGERVGQGTMIMTGDESAVEITFEDGTSLLLRSNTYLEVSSARKKSSSNWFYQLFLDIGRAKSKIKRATGQESRFEIHTPSAVAAARGTEFRLSVDAEVATRCEVLKGAVGIVSKEQVVELKEGEGTIVKANQPPAEPKALLAPPNPLNMKPLYVAMPMVFRFEKVETAVSYRVMLARDADFKDVVKERVIKPDETLEIVGLDDGSYFLQSRSIDDLGLEGPPSKTFVAKVRVNPMPPFIQSPINGSEYQERSVRISWMRVQDAKQYQVQIAKEPDFSVILQDRDDVNGLSWKTGVLDFSTYYFRVRSIAEDEHRGIWSDTLSFSIVAPPPPPPRPPAPKIKQPEMEKKTIHIRWRDLGQGVKYRFQMAKDEGFSEILEDRIVESPEVTLDRPEEAGLYYVRTRGIDAEGYEGDFSMPQVFEIEEKFPYIGVGVVLGLTLIMLLI